MSLPDRVVASAAWESSDSGEATDVAVTIARDLVARIKEVLAISGGFGTVVGFVHDWANPENTFRSSGSPAFAAANPSHRLVEARDSAG